jgi:hypothetical protein
MSEPSTGEAAGAVDAPARLKFLVLHGLGMDRRGYVDVDKWGTTTLAQYNEFIQAWAAKVSSRGGWLTNGSLPKTFDAFTSLLGFSRLSSQRANPSVFLTRTFIFSGQCDREGLAIQ